MITVSGCGLQLASAAPFGCLSLAALPSLHPQSPRLAEAGGFQRCCLFLTMIAGPYRARLTYSELCTWWRRITSAPLRQPLGTSRLASLSESQWTEDEKVRKFLRITPGGKNGSRDKTSMRWRHGACSWRKVSAVWTFSRPRSRPFRRGPRRAMGSGETWLANYGAQAFAGYGLPLSPRVLGSPHEQKCRQSVTYIFGCLPCQRMHSL